MKFAGKVAAITGSAQGIGFAFGEALAREGASIAVLDIDAGRGAAAAAAIEASGGRATSHVCDVADDAAVDAVMAAAATAHGGIDILINCAAKHLMEYNKPCTILARDKWRRMLDVNVTGIVNCAAAVHPFMKARGGGVILNLASIAGFIVTTSYGVSKLAVRGLTVALADEFAPDHIRVCCIAPGIVDSESAMAEVPRELIDQYVQQHQLIKRQGRMQDLVQAMLFLCSDDAGFITGETLPVSGGHPRRI